MAVGRNLKGITVTIDGDATGLTKALSKVNSEIKSTQAQLKDVNKLLKLDPGNTELITQKHKLLGETVKETKEKLKELQEASKQADQALANGTISQEQYDALQREIIETAEELKKLEEQARESGIAVQEIAEKGEKLKDIGGKVSDVGESMTRNLTLAEPDADVIQSLLEEGVLMDEQNISHEGITFRVEDMTPQGLTNLVCMVSARAYLFNKIIRMEAFFVDPVLINRLRDVNAKTVAEFLECVMAKDAREMLRGISFTCSTIRFDGFPDEPEFRTLAELMVEACNRQNRMKAFVPDPENEKYAFRTFLNTVGMKGEEYTGTREFLITRFARNTDIILSATRELKELGIGVYFELQNINTQTQEGELLMTLLGAFGQAESHSSRQGTQMAIQRKLDKGRPNDQLKRVYGYTKMEDGTVTLTKDAMTVMEIFEMAADGFTVAQITAWLNEEGIPSPRGTKFCRSTVQRIIQNEEYKGDFVARKYIVDEHRKEVLNTGQTEKFYFKDNHIPIVTEELWDKAQKAVGNGHHKNEAEERKTDDPKRGLLFCGECGRPLYLSYKGDRNVWYCSGKVRFKEDYCKGIVLPDADVPEITQKTYITDIKERGRHVRFTYDTEEQWSAFHIPKRYIPDIPELTEENYPYMNRIFCKYCGGRLRRIIGKNNKVFWICAMSSRRGKDYCKGIRIPDEKLKGLKDSRQNMYIGKEIIHGKSCYGYSSKPDTNLSGI